MKLRDTSSFNLDDLRAFIRAGCRYMGVPTRGLVVVTCDGWRGKWRPSLARYGTRARPGRWMRIVVKHHVAGADPGPEVDARTRWLTMHSGRPIDGDVPADSELARGMAHVIEHECLHLLGVRHRDMTLEQRYFSKAKAAGKTYDWAAGLGIRQKEQAQPLPAVARLDLARAARQKKSAQTEARTRELHAQWERRLKSATRKCRELRTKVRYYDKKRQAAGKQLSP